MTTSYEEFVHAAHEAGYDIGTTSHGQVLHAVDFDTDSVRAKVKGEPDQLACGKSSDAERVDDGEERKICGNCLVELGVKEKRAVTDGGSVQDETTVERLDPNEYPTSHAFRLVNDAHTKLCCTGNHIEDEELRELEENARESLLELLDAMAEKRGMTEDQYDDMYLNYGKELWQDA